MLKGSGDQNAGNKPVPTETIDKESSTKNASAKTLTNSSKMEKQGCSKTNKPNGKTEPSSPIVPQSKDVQIKVKAGFLYQTKSVTAYAHRSEDRLTQAKIASLTKEVDNWESFLASLSKDNDLYRKKLKAIAIICQEENDHSDPVIQRIADISLSGESFHDEDNFF